MAVTLYRVCQAHICQKGKAILWFSTLSIRIFNNKGELPVIHARIVSFELIGWFLNATSKLHISLLN